MLVSLVAVMNIVSVLSLADEKLKTASIKGKVLRSDTNEPIANALIILMDEKRSDQHDNSVEARADEHGNYTFQNVPNGKYTVSIRAWYKKQEDAPCQLLIAKTRDKNSTVMVVSEKDRFVQQLFIKGFSVKAGKEIVKDFDFACKSMFAE
jgi:hypothetical protein